MPYSCSLWRGTTSRPMVIIVSRPLDRALGNLPVYTGASFSENFYGLKRRRKPLIETERAKAAVGGVPEEQQLGPKELRRSLLFLVNYYDFLTLFGRNLRVSGWHSIPACESQRLLRRIGGRYRSGSDGGHHRPTENTGPNGSGICMSVLTIWFFLVVDKLVVRDWQIPARVQEGISLAQCRP